MMGVKLTRDLDSVEMLDLIYSSIVFDIGRNYVDGGPLLGIFPNLLQNKKTDLVSEFEKYADQYQKQLDDLYEAVINRE